MMMKSMMMMKLGKDDPVQRDLCGNADMHSMSHPVRARVGDDARGAAPCMDPVTCG